MSLVTLVTYLLGSRKSVLKIASSRQAIWVGLLLVFSAGLAREYDGEDLLHEPWHLLLPLAASLVSSLLLYLLVFAVARRRRCRELPFLQGYRSFLGLYWFTAPLAWLYAIPVERFLSAGDATSANLWLLAVVSAWRVALMTRVISVLFQSEPRKREAGVHLDTSPTVRGSTVLPSLALVMFFGTTLMLTLMQLTPIPVFAMMGGIRLTESEQVLQMAAFLAGAFGVLSWPVWALAVCAILIRGTPEWRFLVPLPVSGERATASVWILAVAAVVVWATVLPVTQPEQQLRRRVERQLRGGQIAEALELMSAHARHDFPPHWDPPPRLAFRQPRPPILDVIEVLIAGSPSPWVRQLWMEKLESQIERIGPFHHPSAEEMHRYLTVLEAFPEIRASIRNRYHWAHFEATEDYPEPLRQRIRQLVDPEPIE